MSNDGLYSTSDATSSVELQITQLRQRWELASVLNFLNVFRPVLGNDFKLTAEEIELGLVKPDNLIARLHISLLKGIPPVSKTLDCSNKWLTVLCKKLAMWWPWVAEGDLLLFVANGEEISIYKQLNPTDRLLILKALCEIRADQEDVVKFVNDALKSGTKVSCFRKDKIVGDGNTISYWCDGNEIIGYRLYKEEKETHSREKILSNGLTSIPSIDFQWKTIATNFHEFQNVMKQFSCSTSPLEAAALKTIEIDVIPILKRLHKKKERALVQKQLQERVRDGFTSCGLATNRTCRNRPKITYTYDEYDRAIKEAISLTEKRRLIDEDDKNKRKKNKPAVLHRNDGDGDDSGICVSPDDSHKTDISSTDSPSLAEEISESEIEDDDDDDFDCVVEDDDDDAPTPVRPDKRPSVTRAAAIRLLQPRNTGARYMLRQRPALNSALVKIVPDSDEEEDVSLASLVS